MRRCTSCFETMPSTSFYVSKMGSRSACKSCFNKKAKEKRQNPRRSEDFLYVMANTLLPNMYKIGRAKDVEQRAASLMASHPFEIVVLASFPKKAYLEKGIHRKLDEYNVCSGPGQEWFECPLPLIFNIIGQAMQADASDLVSESTRHGVELTECTSVSSCDSTATGTSLSTERMATVNDEFAGTSLATDRSRSPVVSENCSRFESISYKEERSHQTDNIDSNSRRCTRPLLRRLLSSGAQSGDFRYTN